VGISQCHQFFCGRLDFVHTVLDCKGVVHKDVRSEGGGGLAQMRINADKEGLAPLGV